MSFIRFVEMVPKRVLSETNMCNSEEVAIFRPKIYITDCEMYSTGYHFVLPSSTPPPTKLDNKDYQFRKGRLIAFDPETKVLTTKKVPTEEYIAFTINREFFQNITWEITGKRDVKFKRVDNVYSIGLINLIRSFEDEVHFFKESCPLMLKSISIQLVIQLLREGQNNISIKENKAVPEEKYVKKAVEYIEGCYSSNITLEDICSFVHLSQYHFIRMFKLHTGITPHQYLLKFRLRKAEELLKKGEHKIEEVTRLCGFVSTAHFIALFKRIYGLTPLEYKKAIL